MAHLPPGPSSPGWLQTIAYARDPKRLLDQCAARYGDAFTLKALGSLVILSHPTAIEALFTAPPGTFETGRVLAVAEPIVGPSSIGLLDGSPHHRHRRLLLPAFHGKALATYPDTIRQLAYDVFTRQPLHQPIDLVKCLQEITLKVLLTLVFGLQQASRSQQLIHLLSILLEGKTLSTSPLFLYFTFLQKDWGSWSPWSQFLALRQALDDILYAEIQDRRMNPDPSRQDILALMMATRDEDNQGMTDVEIRDELMTLLHSGYSTTSAALAWALYWIHCFPDVQTRLRQDLQTYDPTDNQALENHLYLRAVCQETLRIYPVSLLGMPRRARQTVQIMNYTFDPGTVIMPGIYLTHRRPDLFPDPDTFNPDRFLKNHYSPYEYYPFGGGSRLCIGLAFAQLQMKLVLATLLTHWSLTLVSPQSVQPCRRGLAGLKPSTPLWVKIEQNSTNRRGSWKIQIL